jgi:hypothetical protein
MKIKWNLKSILWEAVCIISYLLAIWICVVNIQEITDRARGHYTFYSQRASLSDGEAVIYFGLWTVAFIVLFILSFKNAIKGRIVRAGIYSVILILLIAISTYVDTLFYNRLP